MYQSDDNIEEDSLLMNERQASSSWAARDQLRSMWHIIGLYAFAFSFGALISNWITRVVITSHEATQRPTVFGQPPYDMPVDLSSSLLEIDRNLSTQWFSSWNFTPNEWNEHPQHGRVDTLWKKTLGLNDDFFLIPTEEGAQYGLDPRFNVVLRNVEGKYDGFPVVIEASHQLHCLDALRRKLFMNRDWYMKNWKHMANPELELAHTAHCLNMLRETLMCRSDIGLIPWRWAKGRSSFIPEFRRAHRCHNYTAVLEFVQSRSMPKTMNAYLENQAPPPDALYIDVE